MVAATHHDGVLRWDRTVRRLFKQPYAAKVFGPSDGVAGQNVRDSEAEERLLVITNLAS